MTPAPMTADPNDCPEIQTPAEERVNCATHAVGLVLSLAALVVLVVSAAYTGDARRVVSVTIFGAALLLLYAASTCYHGCTHERAKHRLKILDHVGIYCLIAGSYTPFLLVMIRGAWGWSLFGVLWGLAVAGTVFKFYFVHRWDVLSTFVYIAMGWIGVIAAGPALQRIPGGALGWIAAGGLIYTVGTVFYLWERLPYNHAVWHLFVMAGSGCHVVAVLVYVV